MMTSGHGLPFFGWAVRTNPKWSVYWLPVLVLIAHAPLDMMTHIEPNLFGLAYDDPTSLGFVWTVADIGLTTYVAYRLGVIFPRHRVVIWLCWLAAVSPDIVMALAGTRFFFKYKFMREYDSLHWWFHSWGNYGPWSRNFVVITGTINMVLLWFVSWWFMPRPTSQVVEENQSEVVTV